MRENFPKYITPVGKNYFIRVVERFVGADEETNKTRNERKNPTLCTVKRLNEKRKHRKLRMLIEENFSRGDSWITLTYEIVPTYAEARNCLKNFHRRMRKLYKSMGLEYKWICDLAISSNRSHHHLLIPVGANTKQIQDCWPYGNLNVTPCYLIDGGFGRLVTYFIQNATPEGEEYPPYNFKTYTSSTNIKRPATFKKLISPDKFYEDEPKAPDGFEVVELEEYINPITGRKSIEYILMPLRDNAKMRGVKNLPKARAEMDGYEKWLIDNIPYQITIDAGGII
jgi:hypothetical protein